MIIFLLRTHSKVGLLIPYVLRAPTLQYMSPKIWTGIFSSVTFNNLPFLPFAPLKNTVQMQELIGLWLPARSRNLFYPWVMVSRLLIMTACWTILFHPWATPSRKKICLGRTVPCHSCICPVFAQSWISQKYRVQDSMTKIQGFSDLGMSLTRCQALLQACIKKVATAYTKIISRPTFMHLLFGYLGSGLLQTMQGRTKGHGWYRI